MGNERVRASSGYPFVTPGEIGSEVFGLKLKEHDLVYGIPVALSASIIDALIMVWVRSEAL